MNSFLRGTLLASLAAGLLTADVSYTQDTKFKGGTLIDMVQKMASMPLVGRMMSSSKQAFEDQHSQVYIKGNKMARLGGPISTIYDLDAGTVTSIDNNKHTYSTQTFEEMRARMEQMQQRMNKGQEGDIQFDVKAEKTGNTQTLDGQTATETLMTLTAKQATAEGQMVVKVHAWTVPSTPATREAADFHRRLSEKLAFAMSGMSPAMGSAGSGLSAAMREAFKQEGYPVLTDSEITGVAPSGPMAARGGGNADPNAPLIRTETLSTNFARGSVDDAKFSIPADYKEEKPHRR